MIWGGWHPSLFGLECLQEPSVDVTVQGQGEETLAEIVGTTRSRVNFFMNKFRDLGFIEYNGDIKVKSALLTVVLHD